MTKEHEHINELLPWHLNGTLDGEERARARRHLSDCVTCRSELRELGTVRDVVRDEIMPRFDAYAGLASVRRRLRSRGATAFEVRHARPLRWILAGQVAALVMLGALLGARHTERDSIPAAGSLFRTLAESEAAAAAGALRVRVLFAENVTEHEIRQLLADAMGRIVDGPSPIGLFMVELEAGDDLDGADSLEARLSVLRNHAGVRFVRPVRPAQPEGAQEVVP